MRRALHVEHTYAVGAPQQLAGINKDLTSSDQSALDLDAEMDKSLLCGLGSHPKMHWAPRNTLAAASIREATLKCWTGLIEACQGLMRSQADQGRIRTACSLVLNGNSVASLPRKSVPV